jgi:hypothetical protein
MAITYPYIGTNPQPVVPAGATPQQRYQSGMGLGLVNPFATSTMMPASPMARTNYLEPTMAAIAARTTQPLQTPTSIAMPTAPLARTSRVPVPQPRPAGMPQTPPSGLDRLRAAQLRMPAKGSPALAGMGAAAATGLQLSGYQDRPLTTGQIAGSMLQSFNEAADVTRQRQADAQQQAIANELAMMQLYQKAMPEPSKARRAAMDIGLDPDSPEGQQFMRDFLMKSGGVTVEAPKTESAYQAELGKYAVTRLKGLDEELLNEQTNIVPRLNLIESALESGSVTTGAGAGFVLDFKRIANAMGVLPSDQIDQLGDQELVQKTISYLIPRYRVAGSGSTSDMEINLFSAAVPSLSTTTRGNLILIKGMKQMSRFKKQYRDEYMNYLSNNQGDPTGFEQQFESSGASPFYSPESDEELDGLVEKGFIREGDVFYDSVSGGFQIYG